MKYSIQNLNEIELMQTSGGVTEGPDGKGCTEHDLPGLPDLGPVGPTIEIDPSI